VCGWRLIFSPFHDEMQPGWRVLQRVFWVGGLGRADMTAMLLANFTPHGRKKQGETKILATSWSPMAVTFGGAASPLKKPCFRKRSAPCSSSVPGTMPEAGLARPSDKRFLADPRSNSVKAPSPRSRRGVRTRQFVPFRAHVRPLLPAPKLSTEPARGGTRPLFPRSRRGVSLAPGSNVSEQAWH